MAITMPMMTRKGGDTACFDGAPGLEVLVCASEVVITGVDVLVACIDVPLEVVVGGDAVGGGGLFVDEGAGTVDGLAGDVVGGGGGGGGGGGSVEVGAEAVDAVIGDVVVDVVAVDVVVVDVVVGLGGMVGTKFTAKTMLFREIDANTSAHAVELLMFWQVIISAFTNGGNIPLLACA